jgi:hypothetical protein
MRLRLLAVLDLLARLGEYTYESVVAPGYWYEFDLNAPADRFDRHPSRPDQTQESGNRRTT